MPEDQTPQEQAQPQAPAETTPPSIEELTEKIKAELEAKVKSEISGLNRKNGELQKELEKERLAKMSETERQKEELRLAEEKREKAERDALNFQKSLLVNKGLHDAGLPLEFSKRISGDSEDEIKADIDAVKKFLDAEVTKRVAEEVNKKLAGGSPQGGSTAGKKTIDSATFRGMSGKEQSAFILSGGQIKD